MNKNNLHNAFFLELHSSSSTQKFLNGGGKKTWKSDFKFFQVMKPQNYLKSVQLFHESGKSLLNQLQFLPKKNQQEQGKAIKIIIHTDKSGIPTFPNTREK